MKKVTKFLKKRISTFKSLLQKISLKRALIVGFGILLLSIIVSSFFKQSYDDSFYEASKLTHYSNNQAVRTLFNMPLYTSVRQNREARGVKETNVERDISTGDMTGVRISQDHVDYGSIVSDYANVKGVSQDVFLLDGTSSATYEYLDGEGGLYYLALDYYQLQDNIGDTKIEITINGVNQFSETQALVLPSRWEFITTDFTLDRFQNEIQPRSEKINKWKFHEIDDFRGMHPGLFAFELNQGDIIEVNYVNGQLLIGQLYFVNEDKLKTYQEYLNSHLDAELMNDEIQISARSIYHRNDPSIRLKAEQNASNMYYHTQFLRLNTIFGESWQNGGQAITYQVHVENSGFYYLSFKYRQYRLKDMPVFRKILINGEVPFDLFESYAFPYSSTFINRKIVDENGERIKVYFEQGTNTITLEAVNYPYRKAIETIQYVMSEIQSLSLDIKRYTSGGTDRFRDWDIETYFPDAASDILKWAAFLDKTYEELLLLTSADEPSEIANLKIASSRLKRIAGDINKLPSLMVQFSDGDSSVNQSIGNLLQRLMRSNLELERTIVHGDNPIERPFPNIFVSFWEGTKRLVLSFINNPYSASNRRDEGLEVWVNHPRQHIQVMQTLIDENYTGGIRINLSQMPDQNKLILANASGQAPDVALGVNHWIPYDFAVRDAALDLRQFAGFEQTVSQFSKGAMIPYVFEEGVFGLPGTQNFWVTYYRKDILESIGVTEIPQTWDEIIEILPLLQSYGMNYFSPMSQFSGLKPFVATLPFIYQFGGDLFSEDGMKTNINSEEAIEGITLMSELFTLYNMPKFTGSFFNHFRQGLLPIGISDLSTYVLLDTVGVELDGLWGMDLHPGVYNEETGEIIRYSSVGAQASMIMSETEYPQEAWDFLQWWMSTEIQTEFAFLLQSIYGRAYFWNSANIDAFSAGSMPQAFKDVVLAQWEHAIEAPRIPGAYMVEREISNAWTKIVFHGANPRQALDEAVRISNREILHKMEEFGYTYRGVIIKNYTVPSIYNIEKWLTEVTHD